MSNSQRDELSERDEVEALMPWYVSGKLDARSRERVELYLEAHPEDRAHLAFAREEMDATVAANEAVRAPGPEALDRLRASLAAAPRRRSLLTQLGEGLTEWISGLAPPRLALATAAAALVLILQAAVIGGLLLERTSAPAYRTASGEESAVKGMELLVGFADTATAGEISALLEELDAVVVDGPRSGLYRLRRPEQADERSEQTIELLQKSGLVTVILPGG